MQLIKFINSKHVLISILIQISKDLTLNFIKNFPRISHDLKNVCYGWLYETGVIHEGIIRRPNCHGKLFRIWQEQRHGKCPACKLEVVERSVIVRKCAVVLFLLTGKCASETNLSNWSKPERLCNPERDTTLLRKTFIILHAMFKILKISRIKFSHL